MFTDNSLTIYVSILTLFLIRFTDVEQRRHGHETVVEWEIVNESVVLCESDEWGACCLSSFIPWALEWEIVKESVVLCENGEWGACWLSSFSPWASVVADEQQQSIWRYPAGFGIEYG